jgi:adenine-specific DNA methylase
MESFITTEEKLKERIKELNCLYEVSSIIINCDYNNMQHCLHEIAICLKNSLLYNNQAYVEIKTKDFIVTSDDLPKKMVSIESPIYVFNKKEGVLKAGYDDKLFVESVFCLKKNHCLLKLE